MYDASDPRASLAQSAKVKPTGPFAEPQVALFPAMPSPDSGKGDAAKFLRSQNIVVKNIEITGDAEFTRLGQVDEYVALSLDPELHFTVSANGQVEEFDGYTLAIIPPGDSTIKVTGSGMLTLLYTTKSDDLAQLCPNNATYAGENKFVPPFQAWPDPVGGYRIRVYSLDIPAEQGRFGRIFRCTTMMVNVLDPRHGPRDRTKISPHHHDDFEQISLALKGDFTHLIRVPWTPNMDHWRSDVQIVCPAPSACVIPPPLIHTSLSTGADENQLIDIFSPPRVDFSIKPGWVLNADEYPMPQKDTNS